MKLSFRFILILFTCALIPTLSFSDANNVSDDATKIVNDVFGTSDESIPKWLLDRAEAILVIPDYKKDNGENEGIFAVRTDNELWSLPSMANISTAGTLKNKNTKSLVIVIMEGNGLDNLKSGNVILSGEGLAPGPKGTQNKNDFNKPKNDIAFLYTVDDNKATGDSLQQIAITSDSNANKDLYKKDVTIDQILTIKVPNPPEKAIQFQATLNGQSLKKD